MNGSTSSGGILVTKLSSNRRAYMARLFFCGNNFPPAAAGMFLLICAYPKETNRIFMLQEAFSWIFTEPLSSGPQQRCFFCA